MWKIRRRLQLPQVPTSAAGLLQRPRTKGKGPKHRPTDLNVVDRILQFGRVQRGRGPFRQGLSGDALLIEARDKVGAVFPSTFPDSAEETLSTSVTLGIHSLPHSGESIEGRALYGRGLGMCPR